MKYAIVCGSSCFGVNTDSSDKDIAYINTSKYEVEKMHNLESNKIDYLLIEKSDFIKDISLIGNATYGIQLLCPSEFLIENELSSYIKNNRNAYINSSENEFFYYLYNSASTGCLLSEKVYKYFNIKNFAYSLLYLDILNKYADTKDFYYSVSSNDEVRDTIRRIRLREPSYKDVKDFYNELHDNVKNKKNKFNKENKLFRENFISNVFTLLNQGE